VLGKRVNGLDTRRINKTLVLMHVAAIPGAIFAIAASLIIGHIAPAGTITALTIVAVGGAGGLVLYLLAARLLRVAEIGELTKSLRLRFGSG
jgi:putative peptidoglycan lipid II flippase